MDTKAPVVVFGTATCGFCYRARDVLARHRIPFQSIDLTGDASLRARISEDAGGQRTVPIIFVEGRPIGGYRELVQLINKGSLDHLVED
jgi:glutaredoxin 3